MHKESVRDTGMSQSRQNINQGHGEDGQDQERARKPTGEEGIPRPGQEGNRIAREGENRPL
jgi:hypothetical protein